MNFPLVHSTSPDMKGGFEIIDINAPAISIEEWNKKIRSEFLKATFEKLSSTIKLYTRNVCKFADLTTEKAELQDCMMNHMLYFKTQALDMNECPVTEYYELLEDVLVTYCKLELDVINRKFKNQKQFVKSNECHLKAAKEKILRTIKLFLNDQQKHLMHVLLKLRYNTKSEACRRIMTVVYKHVLFTDPMQSYSTEAFCRNYIIMMKFMELVPTGDHKHMENFLFKKFHMSTNSLMTDKLLNFVLTLKSTSLVELINIKRDVVKRYFKAINKFAYNTVDFTNGSNDTFNLDKRVIVITGDSDEDDDCQIGYIEETLKPITLEVIDLDDDEEPSKARPSNVATSSNNIAVPFSNIRRRRQRQRPLVDISASELNKGDSEKTKTLNTNKSVDTKENSTPVKCAADNSSKQVKPTAEQDKDTNSESRSKDIPISVLEDDEVIVAVEKPSKSTKSEIVTKPQKQKPVDEVVVIDLDDSDDDVDLVSNTIHQSTKEMESITKKPLPTSSKGAVIDEPENVKALNETEIKQELIETADDSIADPVTLDAIQTQEEKSSLNSIGQSINIDTATVSMASLENGTVIESEVSLPIKDQPTLKTGDAAATPENQQVLEEDIPLNDKPTLIEDEVAIVSQLKKPDVLEISAENVSIAINVPETEIARTIETVEMQNNINDIVKTGEGKVNSSENVPDTTETENVQSTIQVAEIENIKHVVEIENDQIAENENNDNVAENENNDNVAEIDKTVKIVETENVFDTVDDADSINDAPHLMPISAEEIVANNEMPTLSRASDSKQSKYFEDCKDQTDIEETIITAIETVATDSELPNEIITKIEQQEVTENVSEIEYEQEEGEASSMQDNGADGEIRQDDEDFILNSPVASPSTSEGDGNAAEYCTEEDEQRQLDAFEHFVEENVVESVIEESFVEEPQTIINLNDTMPEESTDKNKQDYITLKQESVIVVPKDRKVHHIHSVSEGVETEKVEFENNSINCVSNYVDTTSDNEPLNNNIILKHKMEEEKLPALKEVSDIVITNVTTLSNKMNPEQIHVSSVITTKLDSQAKYHYDYGQFTPPFDLPSDTENSIISSKIEAVEAVRDNFEPEIIESDREKNDTNLEEKASNPKIVEHSSATAMPQIIPEKPVLEPVKRNVIENGKTLTTPVVEAPTIIQAKEKILASIPASYLSNPEPSNSAHDMYNYNYETEIPDTIALPSANVKQTAKTKPKVETKNYKTDITASQPASATKTGKKRGKRSSEVESLIKPPEKDTNDMYKEPNDLEESWNFGYQFNEESSSPTRKPKGSKRRRQNEDSDDPPQLLPNMVSPDFEFSREIYQAMNSNIETKETVVPPPVRRKNDPAYTKDNKKKRPEILCYGIHPDDLLIFHHRPIIKLEMKSEKQLLFDSCMRKHYTKTSHMKKIELAEELVDNKCPIRKPSRIPESEGYLEKHPDPGFSRKARYDTITRRRGHPPNRKQDDDLFNQLKQLPSRNT